MRDFCCLPHQKSSRTNMVSLLRQITQRVPSKHANLRGRLKNRAFSAWQRLRSLAAGLHSRAGRIRPPLSSGIGRFFERLPLSIKSMTLPFALPRFGWRMGKSNRTPKRCIGIDIGRVHVHAVQIGRTPEGIRIEKGIGIQTRRSTDSLVRVLHSLTHEHGFDPHAQIAVSLPHQTFFFADVETDPAQMAAIQAGDTASLKDCFPIPAEDVIARICSVLPAKGGNRSLLVAAASCQSLCEQLKTLREAGIEPASVDTPTTAAHATIMASHPEAATGQAVMLYVDESTLSIAILCDGNIIFVRNLPMFSDDNQDTRTLVQQTADIVAEEIEITWRRLFGKASEAGLRIFLIASRRMAESLASGVAEKIDCRIIAIDPYAGVAKAEAIEADFSLCVAEGLARQSLQPRTSQAVDFLAAYRARTRPAIQPRRELAICGGLAAAAAVVWAIGLFIQMASLESRYENLKEQETAIFQRVAPDEQTIVNPAAQLQQRLDILRQDAEMFTCFNPGRLAPLEVLSTLSRQMPGRGLQLHDVLIAGDTVRISGSCDSFATFSEWQRTLEKTPGLQLTDAPQHKMNGKSGRVEFQVSMSTTEKKLS